MSKANNKGLLFGLLSLGYVLTGFSIIIIVAFHSILTGALDFKPLISYFIMSIAFFLVRTNKSFILTLIGYAYFVVTFIIDAINTYFFTGFFDYIKNFEIIFLEMSQGNFLPLGFFISSLASILLGVVSILSVVKLVLNKKK